MKILLVTTLNDKCRKFISRFVSADGQTRFALIKRTLWYAPLLFFTGLTMPIVAIMLKMLEPVIKIRIGFLPYFRIGEMTHRIDLHLRRQALHENSNKEFYIFLSGKPCNRQMVAMIKRRVFVYENRVLYQLYLDVHKYTKNSKIWVNLPYDVSTFQEFNQVPPQLIFTEEEKARGKDELLRMGIVPEDSFVCFHARDETYLDTVHSWRSRDQWAYHDYRDSDIRNYLPAAKYLASVGLFAVRMGHIVKYAVNNSNPQIIDYATYYRSDFGDIYLPGNCKFFLGDNSGLHCVAQAFGVPVAAANWIPIKYPLVCKHDLFIPKKLWSIEKKRFLTLREIITSGIDSWVRSEQYTNAEIEVVENTPEEILALAKEVNARLDNIWAATEEDEELQQRYRSLFPPGHYAYGFPSRIGTEFLLQNRELLE